LAGSNTDIHGYFVKNTSVVNKLRECLSDTKSRVNDTREYSRINNAVLTLFAYMLEAQSL